MSGGVLERQLRAIVGAEHVLVDQEQRATYERDWTGRFIGQSLCVVRPRTAGQVADVVALCRAEGVALMPQGGNTGLVGGATPLGQTVVLSTQLLASIRIDTAEKAITVGAGVSIQQVQDAAERVGLVYGVDLASRGSATVGGTIATNAGGLRVLYYGGTRKQILGLEAVLGTGEVLSRLGGLRRDNCGYDWPSLLCGSEGTLAVVTAATLRLMRRSGRRYLLMIPARSTSHCVELALAARGIVGVAAVEFMQSAGIELVAQHLQRRVPLDSPAALLVEILDGPAVQEVIDGLPGAQDSLVGESGSDLTYLWQWRERHTEAINRIGTPIKMDVTLPGSALAQFIDQVPAVVRQVAPHGRCWLFGHLGEGNVHVNVTGAHEVGSQVEDVVFRMVLHLGGSISTEHGIGRSKRRWMPLARSEAELRTYRSIKAALDPDGILNPGVLV